MRKINHKSKCIKITNVKWFYRSFKIMILRFWAFPLFCPNSVQIYTAVSLHSLNLQMSLRMGLTMAEGLGKYIFSFNMIFFSFLQILPGAILSIVIGVFYCNARKMQKLVSIKFTIITLIPVNSSLKKCSLII